MCIRDRHKIGGNIIWQDTNQSINGDNSTKGYNRDYWAVIILTGHEIQGLDYVYSGETQMTSLGSNKWETQFVHVKFYNSSTSTRNIQDVNFWVINDSGGETSGSSMGMPSVTIPAGVAFLAVHQVFDGENTKNTALEAITVKVQGKKVRSLAGGGNVTVATYVGANRFHINGVPQQTLELVGFLARALPRLPEDLGYAKIEIMGRARRPAPPPRPAPFSPAPPPRRR